MKRKTLKLERHKIRDLTIRELTQTQLQHVRGGNDAGDGGDFICSAICNTTILISRLTCG